jgi:hypothetical protein
MWAAIELAPGVKYSVSIDRPPSMDIEDGYAANGRNQSEWMRRAKQQ